MERKEESETKIFNDKEANKVMGFLMNSYEDYLSSRLLFINGKILQGCFLACTALEKFFKVLLIIDEINFKYTHDIIKLYDALIENEHSNLDFISLDFLEQINKSYKCRYIDDLEDNFNITLFRLKYLAELDFIYSKLEKKIRTINQETGEQNKSLYEIDIIQKNKLLCTINHVVLNIDKTKYIEQTDMVFEFRKIPDGPFLQTIYPTNESKNDGKFNFEALIIGNDHKSAKMSHPILKEVIVNTEGHKLKKVQLG